MKKKIWLILLSLQLLPLCLGQSDDFSGEGPLLGYTTNNAASLPDVQRMDGRYRANLTNNSNNASLHFNGSQGRLDGKLVRFPFVYIARNIGIGTQENSQVAPAPVGNPYIFAGIQVHVTDLEARDSSHVVVGHRGSTHFTIEGKNTVNGNSSVNDDGFEALSLGRADIRIEGTEGRALIVSWQSPNLSLDPDNDHFQLYRGSGTLPGEAPRYGEDVYIGLITYAFELGGVPFVGTCDGVEFTGSEGEHESVGPRIAIVPFAKNGLGSIRVASVLPGKTYSLQGTDGLNGWSTIESHIADETLGDFAFEHAVSFSADTVLYRVFEND